MLVSETWRRKARALSRSRLGRRNCLVPLEERDGSASRSSRERETQRASPLAAYEKIVKESKLDRINDPSLPA